MRKIIVSGISILTVLFAAACASSSGGGTVADPGTNQIVPPNPNNCQVGQVDVPNYGCRDQYLCDSGYGWVQEEMRCIRGTVITAYQGFGNGYFGRYRGSLSITNQSVFESVLRYAGVCDPYIGYNWGTWSCGYWASRGGFIDLYTYGSSAGSIVKLFVAAGSSVYSPYSTNYIGFSQTATVVDYNNWQGMQIVGISAAGQDVGLRLIVENGRLTDHSFTARVRYGMSDFATITFVRY